MQQIVPAESEYSLSLNMNNLELSQNQLQKVIQESRFAAVPSLN